MAISLQRLTIYLHSAHRAVIFAIAQLSCYTRRSTESVAQLNTWRNIMIVDEVPMHCRQQTQCQNIGTVGQRIPRDPLPLPSDGVRLDC